MMIYIDPPSLRRDENNWLIDSGDREFQRPSVETGILSERGLYSIWVESGGSGIYSLYVGCTLRDGTVINPGDNVPEELPPIQPPTPYTSFSGIGFPGLNPVDFGNAFRVPFNLGHVNEGEIPPTGDTVLGYKFEATSGNVLELSYTRISGNLNLGLVVLSADNQVVFQTSLVTSDTLSTRFTLPITGEYTIGIFRIDLIPPSSPEPTAFQIQGTLTQ